MDSQKELKEYLQGCNTSRKGQFGEKVFQLLIEERGLQICSLHKEGADFFVNGIGRVDVKAKARTMLPDGSTFPKVSKKLPNTNYCYVIFWKNKVQIELLHEFDNSLSFLSFITWEKTLRWWSESTLRLKPSQADHTSKIKETQIKLEEWVLKKWNLKAKVIYRQGKENQDGMNKSGWGPESFYEKLETKRGVDIKILLYFDGPTVYEVCAYPINFRDQICWKPSPKGPGKKGIYTFNPLELNPKFKFNSISHFKEEFINRF